MDLTGLVAALGSLVLEREAGGTFACRGEPPPWCAVLGLSGAAPDAPFEVEQAFPFLEIFLPDAERVWRCESPRARSNFWTQLGTEGEEIHLEASALRVDSRNLLVITRNEQLFSEKQRVLQRARELQLAHRDLTREVELKDVLVHSIVHDLTSPLHGILVALSLLSALPLGDKAAELTNLAIEAAEREKLLIADILDVFSAEHRAFRASPDPNKAPDLTQTIRQVVRQTQPIAGANRRELVAETEAGPLRVLAAETRLPRVLANLIENALRHTPSGGRVVVSTDREGRTIRVNVDDEGPGVPKEVLPHLFELFAGKQIGVAGTGLGLYFCRITVEQWGGGIGYERRPEGGSRFWIRLIKAGPPQRIG